MNERFRSRSTSRTRRLLVCAGALGLSMLAGDVTHAQQTKPLTMTVTLTDGSVYQGELVEKVPDDHVTLRLATGEIRRFEASQIAPLPTPRPPVIPTYAAPGSYTGADAVRVHVESNKPFLTNLFQAAPSGPSVGWNRLCYSPCDLPVDPKGLYRVGGEHIASSDSFRLSPAPSQTLYVDAGASGTSAFAWISMGLGVALTVPGLYFFTRAAPPPGPHATSSDDSSKLVGGILLINGAPWLITGIVLFAVGGTTVKNDAGTRVARAPVDRSVDLGSGFRLTPRGVTF